MKKKGVKGKKRHEFVFNFARTLLHSWIAKRFNYEYDDIVPPYSPYFVISNHVTNWDPMLVGLSFRKNLYYVSSDHLFRMGFKSKVLKYLFSPIPRVKSAQEIQTVIEMFNRLRDNCNICIFAEGKTTYDGVTDDFPRSISKLIKKAGVALVTYRIRGGYMTFTRFARFRQVGKMSGRLGKIYSPEEIKAMTEEEIYNCIKNDIYVNAWEDQEKNPVAYRGKKPAENLETALYCCPNCKKFSTLKSDDDLLYCDCGFKVRINEYRYFEIPGSDEKPPFKTMFDWIQWQRQEIVKIAASQTLDTDTPVFFDSGQTLYQIVRESHNLEVGKGTLYFYRNRLSFVKENGEAVNFPLDMIIEVSFITMMRIIFSTKEQGVYEIHSDHPRSALKYQDMFEACQSNNKE